LVDSHGCSANAQFAVELALNFQPDSKVGLPFGWLALRRHHLRRQNTELSFAKILSGANAFEVSDIQEDETEAAVARRSNVTMLHSVENRWMESS
jgi:hypothetical protein